MPKNICFNSDFTPPGFGVEYKPSGSGTWTNLSPDTWLDFTAMLPADPFGPPMQFRVSDDAREVTGVALTGYSPFKSGSYWYLNFNEAPALDNSEVAVTTAAIVSTTPIVTFDSQGNPGGFTVEIKPSFGAIVILSLDVPIDLTPYLPADPFSPPATLYFIGEPDAILSIDLGAWTGKLTLSQTGANWQGNLGEAALTWGAATITIDTGVLPVDLTPANRSYHVDSQNLADFQNIPVTSPVEGSPNLTDYIVSLISIPFKLDPSTYADVATDIVIGTTNTDIQAPEMLSDLITIPLGDIEISDLAGNSLDYQAVKYSLVLPFCPEETEIDPQFIVGKTLSIFYVQDIYSGDVTVNLYNGGADPFLSFKSAIGREIPIRLALAGDKDMGAIQGISNGVFTAYVRKEAQKAAGDLFANTVTVEGLLSGFSGAIKVEEIALQTSATFSERQQIVSILNGGVIIND